MTFFATYLPLPTNAGARGARIMVMADGSTDARRLDDDGALISAMADGDERALAALYDQHAALALGVAMQIVGDRQRAEEAVQDAFVQIWKQAAQFDAARGSLRHWLVMLVRRRAIDRVRHEAPRARAQRILEAAPSIVVSRRDTSTDPLDETLKSAQGAEMQRVIRALPQHQRQVIELAFFAGLSQREIATALEIPLGTVKTRTLRALARLRTWLSESGMGGALDA